MFRTPNTSTRIHAKAKISSEAECTVEIFEAPTLTDDGAQVVGKNNDRDSSNVAELLAYAGPTVTDVGALIWAGKIGSGKDAGIAAAFGYSILAKTNETYLFKLTKIPAGTHWIDVDFWWIEKAQND